MASFELFDNTNDYTLTDDLGGGVTIHKPIAMDSLRRRIADYIRSNAEDAAQDLVDELLDDDGGTA